MSVCVVLYIASYLQYFIVTCSGIIIIQRLVYVADIPTCTHLLSRMYSLHLFMNT